MLQEQPKARPSGSNQHGKVDVSDDAIRPKKLTEMGISPDQSSKWQKLANVPEEEFERAVDNPADSDPRYRTAFHLYIEDEFDMACCNTPTFY